MSRGRKAYEVIAVLRPIEQGSRAGDLIMRYLGTQGPAENRRTAMKKGQPKLVAVGRRFTMGLKEKRQ